MTVLNIVNFRREFPQRALTEFLITRNVNRRLVCLTDFEDTKILCPVCSNQPVRICKGKSLVQVCESREGTPIAETLGLDTVIFSDWVRTCQSADPIINCKYINLINY
jgi:hypothetical protein